MSDPLREALQRLYDYEMSEGTDEELIASMAQARSALAAHSPGEALREAFVAGIAEGFVSGRSKMGLENAKKAGRAEAERRYPRRSAPAEPLAVAASRWRCGCGWEGTGQHPFTTCCTRLEPVGPAVQISAEPPKERRYVCRAGHIRTDYGTAGGRPICTEPGCLAPVEPEPAKGEKA